MSATVAVALKKVAIYILGDEKKRGKLFVLIGSIAVVLSISLDTFYSNKNYAARKI